MYGCYIIECQNVSKQVNHTLNVAKSIATRVMVKDKPVYIKKNGVAVAMKCSYHGKWIDYDVPKLHGLQKEACC